jgi:hypothetical protein
VGDGELDQNDVVVVGARTPLKFTLLIDAPAMETGMEVGVNVYPDRLAVTEYEPFARPENV